MPVAHTKEELAAFIPEEARVREAEARRASLFDEHHVRKSVEQYRRLIGELESQARRPAAYGAGDAALLRGPKRDAPEVGRARRP
jgi:hypothetical protein